MINYDIHNDEIIIGEVAYVINDTKSFTVFRVKLCRK